MLLSIAVVIARAAHEPIARRPFCREECPGCRCRDIFQTDSWFAQAAFDRAGQTPVFHVAAFLLFRPFRNPPGRSDETFWWHGSSKS